jgi:hypothetical protein
MSSNPSRPNEIGDEITKQLRAMYDKVLSEPVPERFSELLNLLETSTILPLPSSRMLRNAAPRSKERNRRVG